MSTLPSQSGFASPSARVARIGMLDPLRGLAAFSVMWYHFTQNNKMLAGGDAVSNILLASGSKGWLGVEVFFVISGFVLPYAMWRGRYRLHNYGRFFIKRLLRLEPPYVASLLLTVGLLLVSRIVPGTSGGVFLFDWQRFILHFGYLNAMFGYEWYNPVYWTLAIEFQFYLLVAALFPLAVHNRLSLRLVLPFGLAVLAFLPVPDRFVFHYLSLFALGLATAQRHVGAVSATAYIALLVPLTGVAFLTLTTLQASVGLTTALLIAAFGKVSEGSRAGRLFGWRPVMWLGSISYSVYLLHVPVGRRVVNAGSLLGVGPGIAFGILALAVACSLGASHVFYRLVERPSQRWSSDIKYESHESGQGAVGGLKELRRLMRCFIKSIRW